MEEKQYISRIKLANGEVVDIKDLEARSAVAQNANEIAALVASVGTNSTSIKTIQSAVDAIVQPKSSTEISVSDKGVIGINEMNVNKLVQSTGDTLIIDGNFAI